MYKFSKFTFISDMLETISLFCCSAQLQEQACRIFEGEISTMLDIELESSRLPELREILFFLISIFKAKHIPGFKCHLFLYSKNKSNMGKRLLCMII